MARSGVPQSDRLLGRGAVGVCIAGRLDDGGRCSYQDEKQ